MGAQNHGPNPQGKAAGLPKRRIGGQAYYSFGDQVGFFALLDGLTHIKIKRGYKDMNAKKGMLFTVILLIAVLSATSMEARELASAKIEVRATIPPMQRLTVLNPVAVTFEYPWPGFDQGQDLIIENVGKILVESNSDWALNVLAVEKSGFEVQVRPAGDSFANWLPVTDFALVRSGIWGAQILSWDMRIVAKKERLYQSGEGSVTLAFTLSHLQY